METLKLIIFFFIGASAIFMAISNAFDILNKYNHYLFDICKYLLMILLGLIVYGYTNVILGVTTTIALVGVLQLINGKNK